MASVFIYITRANVYHSGLCRVEKWQSQSGIFAFDVTSIYIEALGCSHTFTRDDENGA